MKIIESIRQFIVKKITNEKKIVDWIFNLPSENWIIALPATTLYSNGLYETIYSLRYTKKRLRVVKVEYQIIESSDYKQVIDTYIEYLGTCFIVDIDVDKLSKKIVDDIHHKKLKLMNETSKN